jgi:dTDP-4-amino-4,6-dideoxygalactose transaminase
MNVPFLDLKAQHAAIRGEINEAIGKVLDSTAFAGGPFVAQFETDFAAYCSRKHAVGVGNGTDALWLALLALDIGPGDEVITAPNSFIATAEAISLTGATPVFVDVDETCFTMNPGLIEAAITPRTKAIIPVHLYGQMADMDPILEIARRHSLHVIEDAAQAHGAEYMGRRAGSVGILGCFSFYPGKNLGACGEAGAVVTDDEELARRMRVFRDHGQPKKYMHSVIGWNARMDGIQGAVLSVKLKHIEAWNDARRGHAARYDRLLGGEKALLRPRTAPYAKHVFHIYAVQVGNRDAVLEALNRCGIHCGIHYPVPIHLQAAYEFLELRAGSFPVAERIAMQLVSLPMYPELTGDQLDRVGSEVQRVLRELGHPVETL